jgi:hypothetical protein
MKITPKQLQVLLQTTIDSLKISYGEYRVFTFNNEQRRRIVSDIINQQSEELIDVKETSENDNI